MSENQSEDLSVFYKGYSNDRETLEMLTRMSHEGRVNGWLPTDLVLFSIERSRDLVSDKYSSVISEAEQICRAGDWDNLTSEQLALLSNVWEYCTTLIVGPDF